MPNFCVNKWCIQGDKAERDKIVSFLATKKTHLDFERMRPLPEGSSSWYEWCCANWGTKWNARDVSVKHGRKKTVYTFRTAWSPVSERMIADFMSAYPTLVYNVIYAEMGQEYYGQFGSSCVPMHVQSADFDDTRILMGELTKFQTLYDSSG